MAKRYTLVIHALHSGGAEWVLTVLANHWAEAGVQVTVITLAPSSTDRYPLRPAVRRVGLNLQQTSHSPWAALRNNARRIRRLRAAIRDSRPQLVLSFTDRMNVLTLLACRRQPWPVILAERNDPRYQRMGREWEFLRRWTYPRCAAAVVQTRAVATCLQPLVRNRPVFVIPNAVVPDESERRWQKMPPDRRGQGDTPLAIMAMGRLEPQKGFDLLISAFARVADRHVKWRLRIVGEGAERAVLEQMARRFQLASRIEFCGWRDEPSPILRDAEFFVLSSRWEGFPNALLEAMSCGLPAVSFNCPSGPAEIIRDQVDGLLVPPEDTEELAAAMDRLMSSPERRRALGSRAIEVVERFSASAVHSAWDRAIASVLGVP